MYSVWAAKRRSKIKLVFGLIGVVFLGVYIHISLYKPPSCYDRKHNQEEVGIDCGGPCHTLCRSQIQSMNLRWARTFEVSPGWWNALAYVENPNLHAYVESASFTFRLYDRAGALILEQGGSTFIGSSPVIPIFLGKLNVGSQEPYRAAFEWTGPMQWLQVKEKHKVTVEEIETLNLRTMPELHAVVRNDKPIALRDIEVVAIVYDEQQNAIASSKTYVDMLAPRGKRQLIFAWPQPFIAPPGRIELVPRIPEQE